MTYSESLEFLYTQLPVFQRVGASAYKPGLDTSLALDAAFGHPHKQYKCIHVAGTNGKGSTAHTIAAVLQSAGYKVGLYTSPHLVDFRERMRVNGTMIPEADVVDFVERYQSMQLSCSPSFFELTMTMAFEWFAKEGIDVAVVEGGLGGRLDSTNIISPVLSVITNISFDHTAFLGDTLAAIAGEKAGIIKPSVPVVIGEAQGEVRQVFETVAKQCSAPILFAQDEAMYTAAHREGAGWRYEGTPFGSIYGELGGACQPYNAATVLTAICVLKRLGWKIDSDAVVTGFGNVCRLTGLMGRWMCLSNDPMVICDTGHNIGGWEYIAAQLEEFPGEKIMIIGFVSDKDIAHILEIMPRRNVKYIFTQAAISRAMDASQLAEMAADAGIYGEVEPLVSEAYKKALGEVSEGGMIFVGGSTFVVADLLTWLR